MNVGSPLLGARRSALLCAAVLSIACGTWAITSRPAATQQRPTSGVALVIAHQVGRPASTADGDARRDADRMAQRLTALGYRVMRENQPSLARYDELFLEFSEAAKDSRAAILYYAGPTAYRGGDIHAESVEGGETIPLIEKFGTAAPVAANRIMIVDGCRIVGPLASREAPIVNAGSRMYVALANTAGKPCADRGPLSPFTAALDHYLGEGVTDLAALMDKTRTAVLVSTKDQQVPWDISTLGRRVSLVPPEAPAQSAPQPGPTSQATPPYAAAPAPLPAPAPPQPRAGPSQWWHNGSLMELRANGKTRAFHYVEPRKGVADMGAGPGVLLFTGERTGEAYAGTAHIFRGRCGKFPYAVSGSVSADQRRVVMTGQAPLVDNACRITGHRPDELVFDLRAEE